MRVSDHPAPRPPGSRTPLSQTSRLGPSGRLTILVMALYFGVVVGLTIFSISGLFQ